MFVDRQFIFLVDSPQPQAPIPDGIARMAKLEHYLKQATRDGIIACFHIHRSITQVQRHLLYELTLQVDGVDVATSGAYQLLEDAYWKLADEAIKSMPKWGKMTNLHPPKPIQQYVLFIYVVNIHCCV